MADWHMLLGLEIDVPIARRRHFSEPPEYRVFPDTVPVVIYRKLQQINLIYIPKIHSHVFFIL